MATTWHRGLHADSEEGPIDVGVAVTPEAMGVAIDAPLLGHLRAAFTVLRDGTTRLTALSRANAAGIETPIIGISDEGQLAELASQLEARASGWAPRRPGEGAGAGLAETTAEQDALRRRTVGRAGGASRERAGVRRASLDGPRRGWGSSGEPPPRSERSRQRPRASRSASWRPPTSWRGRAPAGRAGRPGRPWRRRATSRRSRPSWRGRRPLGRGSRGCARARRAADREVSQLKLAELAA